MPIILSNLICNLDNQQHSLWSTTLIFFTIHNTLGNPQLFLQSTIVLNNIHRDSRYSLQSAILFTIHKTLCKAQHNAFLQTAIITSVAYSTLSTILIVNKFLVRLLRPAGSVGSLMENPTTLHWRRTWLLCMPLASCHLPPRQLGSTQLLPALTKQASQEGPLDN